MRRTITLPPAPRTEAQFAILGNIIRGLKRLHRQAGGA
jgi:hypothetical protein